MLHVTLGMGYINMFHGSIKLTCIMLQYINMHHGYAE